MSIIAMNALNISSIQRNLKKQQQQHQDDSSLNSSGGRQVGQMLPSSSSNHINSGDVASNPRLNRISIDIDFAQFKKNFGKLNLENQV